MMSSLHDWTLPVRSSAIGANDSLWPECLALRRSLEAGVKPAFPPSLVVQVKALACELPHSLGLRLSRLSIEEIRQHVISQGLIAEISGATLWRWLKRLRDKWSNAILVHTPVHASWLNQVEIYFSIVQRKVLTPNDFSSLADLEQPLFAFQCHYERSASPFKWTFTRRDLHTLLAKIAVKRLAPAA
jgi:hypothetical protein